MDRMLECRQVTLPRLNFLQIQTFVYLAKNVRSGVMDRLQIRDQLRLAPCGSFLLQNLAETQDVAQRVAQVMARGAEATAQRQNGSGSCRSRRSRRPRLSQWARFA